MKTLQKFSSVHAAFHNHFNQDRHLISRETHKAQRSAPWLSERRSPDRRRLPCPPAASGDKFALD